MSRMKLRPPREPNTRGARLNDSKPLSDKAEPPSEPAPALLSKARRMLGTILTKKK